MKKNLGFSMVEIVIVMGLMGAMAVTSMKLIDLNTKGAKQVSFKINRSNTFAEMSSMMGNIGGCMATLQGSSVGIQGKTIAEVSTYLNANPLSAGAVSIDRVFKCYPEASAGDTYNCSSKFQTGTERDNITIESYQLAGNELTVTVKEKGLDSQGAGNLAANWTHTFNMNITKNAADEIISCGSISAGLQTIWQRDDHDASKIYYNEGKVSIGNQISTYTPAVTINTDGLPGAGGIALRLQGTALTNATPTGGIILTDPRKLPGDALSLAGLREAFVVGPTGRLLIGQGIRKTPTSPATDIYNPQVTINGTNVQHDKLTEESIAAFRIKAKMPPSYTGGGGPPPPAGTSNVITGAALMVHDSRGPYADETKNKNVPFRITGAGHFRLGDPIETETGTSTPFMSINTDAIDNEMHGTKSNIAGLKIKTRVGVNGNYASAFKVFDARDTPAKDEKGFTVTGEGHLIMGKEITHPGGVHTPMVSINGEGLTNRDPTKITMGLIVLKGSTKTDGSGDVSNILSIRNVRDNANVFRITGTGNVRLGNDIGDPTVIPAPPGGAMMSINGTDIKNEDTTVDGIVALRIKAMKRADDTVSNALIIHDARLDNDLDPNSPVLKINGAGQLRVGPDINPGAPNGGALLSVNATNMKNLNPLVSGIVAVRIKTQPDATVPSDATMALVIHQPDSVGVGNQVLKISGDGNLSIGMSHTYKDRLFYVNAKEILDVKPSLASLTAMYIVGGHKSSDIMKVMSHNNQEVLTINNAGMVEIHKQLFLGGVNHTSDRTLKKSIKKIKGPMNLLKKIRNYTFRWKQGPDKKLHYGVMAQELQKILPELVTKNPAGKLAVNYTELIPLLVEGVKVLEGENQHLAEKLKAQDIILQKFHKRLEALEKRPK